MQIFRERGSPNEVILDNAASFKSCEFKDFADSWKVNLNYRCANRPEGNSIVERNHRVIKRMASRCKKSALDMVFWYNNSPKEGIESSSVPSNQLYQYEITIDKFFKDNNDVAIHQDNQGMKFQVGDSVYVKPANMKCSTVWPIGKVTKVISTDKFEIDGVPRHISHLRRCNVQNSATEDLDDAHEKHENTSCGIEIQIESENDSIEEPDTTESHGNDTVVTRNLRNLPVPDYPT